MSWNAFEKADETDETVQHTDFPEVCGDELSLGSLTHRCRRVPNDGHAEHEVLTTDSTGRRTVRITWR